MTLKGFGLDKKLKRRQCYVWILKVLKTCTIIFEISEKKKTDSVMQSAKNANIFHVFMTAPLINKLCRISQLLSCGCFVHVMFVSQKNVRIIANLRLLQMGDIGGWTKKRSPQRQLDDIKDIKDPSKRRNIH